MRACSWADVLVDSKMESLIHVVAAVIRKGHQVLLAQRPADVHQGGLWEFPGGKVETDENREQALVRELQEELGLTPIRFEPLIRVPHHYPDESVLLDVWEVSEWQGEPQGREGQKVCWVDEDELQQYDFPQANHAIVTACQLPPHYVITPALENDEAAFMQQLENTLANGIRLLQLRQKNLSRDDFATLAAKVIPVCHAAGAKVLLNAEPRLAVELDADGVQLNGPHLMALNERPLSKDYLVAASCHDKVEISKAGELRLDFALLSPVQATASHPDATPLGWGRFNELVEQSNIPVYALGGVGREDTQTARQQGGQGISAIRALWD